MCNGATKPQCYLYRVFGVPMAQQQVVLQIKPGAKLFLYDFGVKLLYGVYEATSVGALNLEPTTFHGDPCPGTYLIIIFFLFKGSVLC